MDKIFKHGSVMPDTNRKCLFVIKEEYSDKKGLNTFVAWLKFVDTYEDDGDIIAADYWFRDHEDILCENIDWIWGSDCHKIEKWAYLDDLLML